MYMYTDCKFIQCIIMNIHFYSTESEIFNIIVIYYLHVHVEYLGMVSSFLFNLLPPPPL